MVVPFLSLVGRVCQPFRYRNGRRVLESTVVVYGALQNQFLNYLLAVKDIPVLIVLMITTDVYRLLLNQ